MPLGCANVPKRIVSHRSGTMEQRDIRLAAKVQRAVHSAGTELGLSVAVRSIPAQGPRRSKATCKIERVEVKRGGTNIQQLHTIADPWEPRGSQKATPATMCVASTRASSQAFGELRELRNEVLDSPALLVLAPDSMEPLPQNCVPVRAWRTEHDMDNEVCHCPRDQREVLHPNGGRPLPSPFCVPPSC